MTMQFQKATRKKAKLRLGISGPSGSGKTMGALLIAKGLGGRIALLDTENKSASLYAEKVNLPNGKVFTPPEFDALEIFPPYTPERFVESIHAAEGAGYDILVIDSSTAEWNGQGGCLELVDTLSRSKFGGNSYMAWSAVTPRHRAFLDAIIQSKLHIIITMRSKTETAQVEENGKKKVVKLGMKAEQRDGFEYEMTTVLDLVHDGHYATASKDRTGLFGGDPQRIDESTGKRLAKWLDSGADPLPEPEGVVTHDAPAVADDPKQLVFMEDQLRLQPDLKGLVKEWGRLWTDIDKLSSAGKARITAVKDECKAKFVAAENVA